jgi:salicylate hydroxylase
MTSSQDESATGAADEVRSRQIIIAGAGIGGLTAALAFAARGFSVQVFDQAGDLREVGAGLQLSPNATRILRRLGVLPLLASTAVRPEAVVLRRAATLAELARVPLGDGAEDRWQAPYLVVHRADLQQALLAAVAREAEITVSTGSTVRDVALHGHGVTVSLDAGRAIRDVRGLLAVGADGVWSTLRELIAPGSPSRFTGHVAWRRTLPAADMPAGLVAGPCVNAFLHGGFHMVAYPIRGGEAVNLVAFTPGRSDARDWDATGDIATLRQALTAALPDLAWLGDEPSGWTVWPVHVAGSDHPWTVKGGVALIGDAAHAMTPFAAQGAAMAIEDADALAECVSSAAGSLGDILPAWEKMRRRRVARVRRRGAFNHMVWNATGALAQARDYVLQRRGPARLAADLDWLYGYDAQAEARRIIRRR